MINPKGTIFPLNKVRENLLQVRKRNPYFKKKTLLLPREKLAIRAL
jgi:hypothetical protein